MSEELPADAQNKIVVFGAKRILIPLRRLSGLYAEEAVVGKQRGESADIMEVWPEAVPISPQRSWCES